MVSVDNIEDNTAFAKKNDASFPILADEKKTMCRQYGVLSPAGYANRWTIYINKQGIIEKIDKAVSPASAGQSLLTNLKKLGYEEQI